MLPNTDKEESSAGESTVNEALAVTTRAKARRQEELSSVEERNEEASGIQPHALDDEVMESQPDSQERQESVPVKEAEVPRAEIIGSEFNEHIFTDVKERVRYTGKQKQRQRKDFAVAKERGESESPLDLNAGDLHKLQQEDEALATIRAAVDGESNAASNEFYRKEGILYRKWTPPAAERSSVPTKPRSPQHGSDSSLFE